MPIAYSSDAAVLLLLLLHLKLEQEVYMSWTVPYARPDVGAVQLAHNFVTGSKKCVEGHTLIIWGPWTRVGRQMNSPSTKVADVNAVSSET